MKHKRGNSFDYVMKVPDTFVDGYFDEWTVAAQVRNSANGNLIAELETSWLDPLTTRNLNLLKIDTSGWAPGKAEFDVKFTRTSDNYKLSTATVEFVIEKDVTQS